MSRLSDATSTEQGFSLLELLLILSILAVLAGFSLVNAGEYRHRLQVDVAARRLQLGLERARLFALSQRQPCGLRVSAEGWQKPLVRELPGLCVLSIEPAGTIRCSATDLAEQLASADALCGQWFDVGWWNRCFGQPSQPLSTLFGDQPALGREPCWPLQRRSPRSSNWS
ncbi:prepilin-type N-terminal cleavage/methylation domain-containing protein [Prochlorococcus marinus]|uniref:prepilin-type N-terminal cleavage/methylation domain-containing protein n=1 Tax=Prochlorococcus marinus TaxID=1219 RepID=UPI0007BB62F8|nr:prepilin-type N-terminal cleavage/methylation domain-containing protein [Prochlorococcus marinus]KZR76697.1 hypothetical protein PMIT1320_00605 [Prochlorococcus marinus str. MIT 1320]